MTFSKRVFPVLVLFSFLGCRALAQTFTTLYQFTDGSDGSFPHAALVRSADVLFGTAPGGTLTTGTVFAINIDGSGFTNLHNFGGGLDGAVPTAGMIFVSNRLYGTTRWGGSSHKGTVFAINPDGSAYSSLYSFDGTNGEAPSGTLVANGNTLYGATEGSRPGLGLLFAIQTDGSEITVLHRFAGGSEGADPVAGLVLSGDALYGTTYLGGESNLGTVFRVKTNGTDFVTLHSFIGKDGAGPYASLAVLASSLYGTTFYGGAPGFGTAFRLNTDGSGFTNLHFFAVDPTDGSLPFTGLISFGSTLYGTTTAGGNSGGVLGQGTGTIFQISNDGSDYRILYEFEDGGTPVGDLLLAENNIFGTTRYGGTSGTIFTLSLPAPSLRIAYPGTNTTLSWPTTPTTFTLQSTTNLSSAASWVTVATSPTIVEGRNTVTNPISSGRQFFRLSR